MIRVWKLYIFSEQLKDGEEWMRSKGKESKMVMQWVKNMEINEVWNEEKKHLVFKYEGKD